MWKVKYEELKMRHSIHEELFEMIKTRPESEMIEALQRIKRGTKAADLLEQLRGGPLLMQVASVLNRDEVYISNSDISSISSYGSRSPERLVP